ncbi:MAG: helix-turn-helix domain-containing protein [Propionibacterium sp.]|nr:helix-turn-helix domain-containing protein [Propionibacterium sp.]
MAAVTLGNVPPDTPIGLRELVDVEFLQQLQDDFAEETGLAMVTVDAAGIPVTEPSRFTSLCTMLRKDPEIRQRCFTCDAHGGFQSAITRKLFVYRCHAGLVDFSVPVFAEEQYLGAVLAGQVLLTKGHEDLNEMHLGLTDLGRVDGALEAREEIRSIDLSKLEAAAKAIAAKVTEALGSSPAAHPGPLFGRPGEVRSGKDGETIASITPGNVKRVPLVPLRAEMTAPDRPHVDPTAIQKHLRDADIGANLTLVSDYLDRLIPRVQQKVPQETLAELEDVLIGVATSEAVAHGRDLSQRVMKRRNRRKGPVNRYDAQVYFERLLLDLHRLVEPTLLPKERTIESLLNEINREPTKFLTASVAAEYLMWSESHFSRQFKKATGDSYINYVTRKRLDRAKFLLEHSDLPVLRIAASLKFQPYNYFSRTFKRFEGITPTQYREQLGMEDD